MSEISPDSSIYRDARYLEVDVLFGDAPYLYMPTEPGMSMIYKKARAMSGKEPDTGIEWYVIDERIAYLDGFEIIETGSLAVRRVHDGYWIMGELNLDTGTMDLDDNRDINVDQEWWTTELDRGYYFMAEDGKHKDFSEKVQPK